MTWIKAAVTFNNLTKFQTRPTSSEINKFVPDRRIKQRAIEVFNRHDLKVTSESDLTLSIEGKKAGFEALFGTRLTKFNMPNSKNASASHYWFPKKGEKWNYEHELKHVIDEAYIQLPHYYARNINVNYPTLSYYHLIAPHDVSQLLNAQKVHDMGIRGSGVKVVMLDSGFHFAHNYFIGRGYSTKVILGPGALHKEKDEHGHGTAMAANLLAVAPGVDFIGIKLANPEVQEYSSKLSEAFEVALTHNPNIISVSLTYDLTLRYSRRHRRRLPNSNKALEGLILMAVKKGITVICATGNGHVGFPGMMDEVISVGGVYMDENGKMEASNFTSAFTSKIYPNRHVPDYCGLSGLYNNDDINNPNPVPGGLILLPVEPKSKLDKDTRDNTPGNDGWTVEGGSSSATAQVAGACALLLQKDPSVVPSEIKEILKTSSRNVVLGNTNKRSNEGVALFATVDQPDLAVGTGLIDAFEAIKLI